MAVSVVDTSFTGGQVTDGTNTITFAAMDAGTPAADRWLVAEITFYDLTAVIQADPSSVVIGGVTASLKSSTNGAAGGGSFLPAIYSYWAQVPVGLTADVTVNLPANANATFIGCSLYAVTGAHPTIPVIDTAGTATTSFTSVTSDPITVPVDGALIAMGSSVNSSGSAPTWTNAVFDTAFNFGSTACSSAHGVTPGTFAVTYADANGSSVDMQINCVAIQKAPPVDTAIFGVIGAATCEY